MKKILLKLITTLWPNSNDTTFIFQTKVIGILVSVVVLSFLLTACSLHFDKLKTDDYTIDNLTLSCTASGECK